MNHLIDAVNQWAIDRDILHKATPRAQAMKTIEEAAELLEACLLYTSPSPRD